MNPLARCGQCGHSFEVQPKFTGGLVPCPRCGKVVDVPGMRDPIWVAVRLGAAVAVVSLGVLVGTSHGAGVGVAAAAAALFGVWLVSRAL